MFQETTKDVPLENPHAIAEKIAADEKKPSLPSPPAGIGKDMATPAAPVTRSSPPNASKGEEDEFALLAKRFEALKKR